MTQRALRRSVRRVWLTLGLALLVWAGGNWLLNLRYQWALGHAATPAGFMLANCRRCQMLALGWRLPPARPQAPGWFARAWPLDDFDLGLAFWNAYVLPFDTERGWPEDWDSFWFSAAGSVGWTWQPGHRRVWVCVPYWQLVLVGAGVAWWAWRGPRERRPADSQARPCARCGYDLRAHRAGERCPECGAAVQETTEFAERTVTQ